jgi:hypothetical protein
MRQLQQGNQEVWWVVLTEATRTGVAKHSSSPLALLRGEMFGQPASTGLRRQLKDHTGKALRVDFPCGRVVRPGIFCDWCGELSAGGILNGNHMMFLRPPVCGHGGEPQCPQVLESIPLTIGSSTTTALVHKSRPGSRSADREIIIRPDAPRLPWPAQSRPRRIPGSGPSHKGSPQE